MINSDVVEIQKASVSSDNPYKFNDYPSSDPRITDVRTYTKVLDINKYEFMDDAYYGSGGFRTGDYLIPFNREYHYNERKQLITYKNFTRPVLRALIDPVFTEEVPRVLTDENGNETESTLASQFLEDVDNDGTTLQDFSEDVVTKARLHGVTFVIVDNFTAIEQPRMAMDAIAQRIYPYLISKCAWEVETWKTDEFGCLTEIMFAEEPHHAADGTVIKRARKWTEEYSQLFKKVSSPDGKMQWMPEEPPVWHNLGIIPVVSVYAIKRRKKSDILVDPPLFDIARLNLTITAKDSEIRDLERAECFSILVIQTDNVSSVSVGPKNALVVPMEATMTPTYISPDSTILKVLVENNAAHREDLFRMAEQSGVMGVQSQSSGVSMAWKFFAQESQLKRTSRMATRFEQEVMNLFGMWTGEAYNYVVDYPMDFQPGDRTQELEIYKKALELPGMTDLFSKKLIEKTARFMLNDESPDELAKIIADIYVEKPKPMPPAPPVPPEQPMMEEEDGVAEDRDEQHPE